MNDNLLFNDGGENDQMFTEPEKAEEIDENEDNCKFDKFAEKVKENNYKDINETSYSKDLRKDNVKSIFSYFQDGTRYVYTVAYHKYPENSEIYPILAGQVISGICKRENRRMKCAELKKSIVQSYPDVAEFTDIDEKINNNNIKNTGWELESPYTYRTVCLSKSYPIKATKVIQDRMVNIEKEMINEFLNKPEITVDKDNFIIKDGSLGYFNGVDESKTRFIVGASKKFSTHDYMPGGEGQSDFIVNLPIFHRTAAAESKNEIGNDYIKLRKIIWYVRLKERERTSNPLSGVIKLEIRLAKNIELDPELIDKISAHIIAERNPTCYGDDSRWANHLYPIYLTESFIKSQYISNEKFFKYFRG
jgi:hypothetical protein